MIVPAETSRAEQLHLFDHVEHVDRSLEGRIVRDRKTGEIILRWATELPIEKDVIRPAEMLNWLAELSHAGRITEGSLIDVWRVAKHLRDSIFMDENHTLQQEIIAEVDYALVDQHEDSLREALRMLRLPTILKTDEGFDAMGIAATQALRLATYRPRQLTIDTLARIHLAERMHTAPDEGAYLHLRSLLHLLGAGVFGRISAPHIQMAHTTFLSVLEQEYPEVEVPSFIRHEKAPDYAGAIATKGRVPPINICPSTPQLDLVA
jgi:hypothetical protein